MAILLEISVTVSASLAGPSRGAFADFTFEVVKSFEVKASGFSPLVVGRDGALYGTTITGGPFGRGKLFRIDSEGSFTSLDLLGDARRRSPAVALVVGSDGALYGTSPKDYYSGY